MASLPSERAPPAAPSLQHELVVGFSLLAAGALLLVLGAVLLAATVEARLGAVVFVTLLAGDAATVVLVGRYLIRRYVLRPMTALTAAADQLASGNLTYRAPAAETREFSDLASQFNQMTERLLDARSQLVRAEKLASIGRLAAGIAHEVGNPLSAIDTYLEVLKKRGIDQDVLAALSRETGRIDRIVRGLLAYARPRDEQTDLIHLGAVLRSAVDLLTQQGVFQGTAVRVESDEDAPRVRGRFHDLEQVAVNLLLNAADAARGGTVIGGVVAWTYEPGGDAPSRRADPPGLGRRSRPSGRRPFPRELASGGILGTVLYVADSGLGVPVTDRDRVFDPFFTTKSPGQGTGLGLAIVERTVHELGGVVWVDDAREGGAAFKVFLPAAGP